MKEGIRVLGIDDSPFNKSGRKKRVLIVGAVYRNGIVEGVLSTFITKDGTDSTSKLSRMVSKSRFLQQIRLIIIHGTMMAGLNVVDIHSLSQKLGVPVIAVTKRRPDMERVYNALRKSSMKTGIKAFNAKRSIIEKAEKAAGFSKARIKGETYFIQPAGIDAKKAEELLNRFGVVALRLAHIIGSGIVKGESSGRI